MYTSFHVKNFKCFQDINITEIRRVNLIAGMNNVGKTSLLEAFFIHAGAYNPEIILRVNAFRGIEKFKLRFGDWNEIPWISLFNNFNILNRVELTGEIEKIGYKALRMKVLYQPDELAKIQLTEIRGYQQTIDGGVHPLDVSGNIMQVLELKYQEGEQSGIYYMIFDTKGLRTESILPPASFPVIFLPSKQRISLTDDAERFGKLEIQGKQDVLLKVLKVIEPRLNRVAMVITGGNPVIHGDIGLNRLIPLPFMGDGMVRLSSIVLAIGNAANGIVLIDEIENGLHHSILPRVWQAIGAAAQEFNTQVFATTHSLECITAAHKAFMESGSYDFRLHRLERKDEKIRAVTYDQEDLNSAIETGFEVR